MSLVSVDEFRKNASEKSADESDVPTEPLKKAYKTSHRKNQATADLRENLREPDPSKPWRIDNIGPFFMSFGKKKLRTSKGKMRKKVYIKRDDKHRIWVHWLQGDGDSAISHWSLELQEYLRKAGLGDQVDACLKRKVIWPYPSNHDGTNPEQSQQIHLCRLGNYKAWCHQSLAFQRRYTWEIHKGSHSQWSESISESRQKLKSYLNEEKVGNWFLETYIQSEDESMTICKDALFAEFEEHFCLKNMIDSARPSHFKTFICEINKCIAKNKSSHFPKVNSNSEMKEFRHLKRRPTSDIETSGTKSNGCT